MNNIQFKNLCRDAGVVLGLANTQEFSDTGHATINEISTAVYFNEEAVRDRFILFFDIADVSKDDEGKIARALLAFNITTGTKNTGVCAFDPETARALFVVHVMNPDRFSAASFANTLKVYVEQVKTIRDAVSESVN